MNLTGNENLLDLLIDEDELETSEQITLYTEFIRILEKDIDDAQTNNTKEGWNTWGILGAIGAAVIVILTQTRELQEIPPETITISIVFILLFQAFLALHKMLKGSKHFVKERKLIELNKAFSGKKFIFVLRFIILLVISFFILNSNFYPLWIRIVSTVLILIPVIYLILIVFLAGSASSFHIGNNPKHRIISTIIGYTIFFFYLIVIILLSSQLSFPVGQSLSAAYLIGISVSAIIFLGEILMSSTDSFEPIAEFQELKDDIIFRRLGLNEGLNKYKIIKEGRSLFDVMKPDFDRIMNYLYRQEEIHTEQSVLSNKIKELSQQNYDPDKAEQIAVYSKLCETNAKELNQLITLNINEFEVFYKKLRNAAETSGDYETEDLIRKLISQKCDELNQKLSELSK